MKKASVLCVVALLAFIVSGCTVRTYPLTRDRIDQDLNSGNRGYVLGAAPTETETERAKTRETQVFSIEFGRPVKVETKKTPATVTEPSSSYTSENETYVSSESEPAAIGGSFEKYTVQKNDTLQKISQKCYGTTKKWTKIYDANKDVLKGPNKVYPGQVLNIPTENMKTPSENLK